MQIASRTGQSVLTTKSEGEVSESAELSRVDQNGSDTEANLTAQASPENTAAQTASAPEPAAEPAPQREQVGAITGQPERAPAPAPAPRTDLPATAGELPLLALMGFGAIAGSRMLRKVRS